jgi:hypothetical protein
VCQEGIVLPGFKCTYFFPKYYQGSEFLGKAEFYWWYNNTGLPSYDLSEFIDLINQQGLGRDHFLLYLTIPPAQKLSHQIDFEIELTNGEKFRAVIENLTIEK